MKRIIEQVGEYYIGYTNVVRSDGPQRVDTSQDNKDFKRRPVGFTANLDEEVEENVE